MGVPERWNVLLPEPTHYCTMSHRKETPKRIARNTLLPIIKYKTANKMSKMKYIIAIKLTRTKY